MLNKLINLIKGKSDPATETVRIPFGRYSDNNKSVTKGSRWTEADNLFKDQKYMDSINAFFDYLKDDDQKNVNFNGSADRFDFEFFQGSKVVRGRLENGTLSAQVKLARMPQPSVPVMRRLLEMNFGLYYSRYTLNNDELCMRFDTNIETANPSKLYYGLKELAIKSDKQDDLLVQDFSFLERLDEDHVDDIPENEKQVKYEGMQSWIKETLEKIASVDADKFSGGICYLLLALVYRIDFLIAPEGQLLNELEKISGIYFKKDDRQMVEKNRDMIEEFKKLLDKPKEEVFKNLFRSRYTFSIVTPQPHKTIADAVHEANNNMQWYRDNSHEYFANKIIEYGLTYCQYSYSLPKPLTQLIEIFMQVNYPEYFKALGYTQPLYMPVTNKFEQDAITARIRQIQNQWRQKYPLMNFDTNQLSFTNLLRFNHSFSNQVELLNMNNE
ncbi:YbjN domain-containing protein [Niabella ginsengisoli]|uniref:YbjN domain-containing protein n=1 Tax=Niabella ginsengisoli TaxID=522298 RepID=A0ABS9SP06_9BACT|nr:YbjN domain-containing protein [Niabella ginsengisoli]MCH5600006.1 YbjN domain-containing protein [Niabella ginsengisoli]